MRAKYSITQHQIAQIKPFWNISPSQQKSNKNQMRSILISAILYFVRGGCEKKKILPPWKIILFIKKKIVNTKPRNK